jgi:hypothetical protein
MASTEMLERTFLISPVPEDTIRILLATDNHIGYLERDPIRGQDSINTFKEILQLAVKNDVGHNACLIDTPSTASGRFYPPCWRPLP